MCDYKNPEWVLENVNPAAYNLKEIYLYWFEVWNFKNSSSRITTVWDHVRICYSKRKARTTEEIMVESLAEQMRREIDNELLLTITVVMSSNFKDHNWVLNNTTYYTKDLDIIYAYWFEQWNFVNPTLLTTEVWEHVRSCMAMYKKHDPAVVEATRRWHECLADIAGVQPMASSSGRIFNLKYVYSS